MSMYSEGRSKPTLSTVTIERPASRGGDALGGMFGSFAAAGNSFINRLVDGGSALVDGASRAVDKGAELLGIGEADKAEVKSPKKPKEPAVETGSAVVMGSASDTEWAFDDSFTPALIGQLDANPDMSIDEVLAEMDKQVLTVKNDEQPVHHPTLVSYGDRSANQEGRTPKKLAAFVANSDYESIGDLNTPGPEAAALEGNLKGRGYESQGVAEDQTSSQMSGVYDKLVSDAAAGDELFAYYAGHGAPEGLVGVKDSATTSDMFTNQQVAGVVDRATSKGAHIHFVMDSCHSGAAVQTVRDEKLNALAEKVSTEGDAAHLLAAECARYCKNYLLDHLERRESRDIRPDVLKPLYQKLEQQYAALNEQYIALAALKPPADDTSDEANALRDELLDKKAELDEKQAELDDQWNALEEDEAWKQWQASHDKKVTRLWRMFYPALLGAAQVLGEAPPPVDIQDHRTLGAQMDFLDRLQNAAMRPVDEALR